MVKKQSVRNMINKSIAFFLAASLILVSNSAVAAPATEIPEASFSGIGNADVMLNNLNYSDIKNSSEWVKDAVYETGALSLIKGYGNRNFGLSASMSKEDAISSIYIAIGREAEGQQLGENLNNARQKEEKKTSALSVWSDGFLQMALNDGLITQQDYADAMEQDQGSLEQESFNRKATVNRQEVAYWLAKALKLEPVYNQQNVYNYFSDWKNADPEKIPYIEAILQSGIMTGDANGNFRPGNAVNKGQFAQIIKNSEEFILPLTGLDKKTGTIEEIENLGDYSGKNGSVKKTFYIRNSNGMLHTVDVEYPENASSGNRNESNGSLLTNGQKDLLVNKNGVLGKSSVLKKGDRIEYITAPDNTVKYVKVLSSVYDTKYYVAKVNKIDNGKRSINASIFFKLDYPDVDLSKMNISFDLGSENAIVNYTYSNNVSVLQDKARADIKSITPESYVILTVKNNMVTGIRTFELEKDGENNVVQGIVEDNNPQLGYITLYNEDGTGVSKNAKQELFVLRTYDYGNQNDLEVFKNHKKSKVEDIEVGDTVFLKLDSNGNVVSLSAADNYVVKYGKVISKGDSTLAVQYDNGSQQVLNVDKNVLTIDNKKIVGYSRLKNGDKVRLLLNITNKSTSIKEIVIEGDESFISNIYKGTVSYIDRTSNKIIAQKLEVFQNGQWARTDQKGFSGLRLAEEYKMYFDNEEIDLDRVGKYLNENEAYIAMQKDYGGEERAVVISFRNEDDTEDLPYDDSITYAVPGTGEFSISKKQEKIKNGEGTIIVKDGRLVSANSISAGDSAFVVANRSYDSGDYLAGIVQIDSKVDMGLLQVYRARIKQIDEMKNFTVESFSQLNGLNWDYANTPKTFTITYDTRIVGDSGVVGQKDFADYGEDSYKNRTVYVIADGTKALLVTTTPYGTINAKGDIFDITGATFGEEGTLLTEPTGLRLTNAKVYDSGNYMWVESKEMALNILSNSIILKDGKMIKASDIRKGDKVRVIKKDSTETGDAYIIIVGGI